MVRIQFYRCNNDNRSVLAEAFLTHQDRGKEDTVKSEKLCCIKEIMLVNSLNIPDRVKP